MGVVWTRRLINVMIGLLMIAILGKVAQTVGSVIDDRHTVSYFASSDRVVPRLLHGTLITWNVDHGFVMLNDMRWLRYTKIAVEFVLLGFLGAVFWKLRGLFTRLASGEMFTDANVLALKRIGQFLLLACAIDVMSTIFIQSVIVNAIPPLEGRAVHPSLSWSVKGVENIWLEYSPPIEGLILSLLAFSAAGAFRQGQLYREDSESVV